MDSCLERPEFKEGDIPWSLPELESWLSLFEEDEAADDEGEEEERLPRRLVAGLGTDSALGARGCGAGLGKVAGATLAVRRLTPSAAICVLASDRRVTRYS